MELVFVIIFGLIFLVIPIHIGISLILYDGLFQIGVDPYFRIGSALNPNDKVIFDSARDSQVKQLKYWSLLITIFNSIAFSILPFLNFKDTPTPGMNFIRRFGFEIYAFILFLILTYYIGSRSLRSPGLRSLLPVLNQRGITRSMVQSRIPDFTWNDKLLNRDYYILAVSFFRGYSSKYPGHRDIPAVHYSILRRDKNGTFNEKYIPEIFEQRNQLVRNYLTITLKQELIITKLWPEFHRLKISMKIGGTGSFFLLIPILYSIYGTNSVSWPLFIVSSIFFFPLFSLLWMSYLLSSQLNFRIVDIILSNNHVWIEGMTLKEKVDKLVELIDDRFPFINLDV